jgi:PAS domain S-box-containing protein
VNTEHSQTLVEHDYFFHHASDLFRIVDAAGRFVDVNSAWLRTFGVRKDDLYGHSVYEFIHPEDQERSRAAHDRLLAGEVVAGFENRYRCNDGSYRWLRWSAIVDLERDRNYGVARDVTEHKLISARLASAQTMLEEMKRLQSVSLLASGLSHHFNNMLCIIDGYSRLLREALEEQPALTSYLDEIDTATSRAVKLVRDLNLFAQRQDPDRAPVSISELLEDLQDVLANMLPSTVEFRLDVAEGLPMLNAHKSELERAVISLVANAREATPAGGVITLKVYKPTEDELTTIGLPAGFDTLAIAVSDTGNGISPEDRDRLFDPFFTTKDIGKGVGLSLSCVHGIVTRHGGWISVDSSEEAGARITLYLPHL